MAKYIYEHPDWPNFTWNEEEVLTLLARVNAARGLLLGKMGLIGLVSQDEIYLSTLAEEIAKSAKIEGEDLDLREVRSSLASRLGIELDESVISRRNVDGIVEVTLDAIYKTDSPLTRERLCRWQAALFPSGYTGLVPIAVGRYRDDARGPMQVVSGALGHEKIHYQAPPAAVLEREVERFLDWFNQDGNLENTLKALVAHLWFVTLHPFEDGNGRLARVIADYLLSKADGSPKRFYSLSAQIEKDKKGYYRVLETTQSESLDVTAYLTWSLGRLLASIDSSENEFQLVFQKHRFLHSIPGYEPNQRQKRIVDMLFGNFQGHLTTSKYALINKISQDTAARDIAELVRWGVLARVGGGRTTPYRMSFERKPPLKG
jgi:Fic family protein